MICGRRSGTDIGLYRAHVEDTRSCSLQMTVTETFSLCQQKSLVEQFELGYRKIRSSQPLRVGRLRLHAISSHRLGWRNLARSARRSEARPIVQWLRFRVQLPCSPRHGCGGLNDHLPSRRLTASNASSARRLVARKVTGWTKAYGAGPVQFG